MNNLPSRRPCLKCLSCEVAQHADGLTFVDFVKKILHSGYKHQGNLSQDLQKTIKNLIEAGILVRDEENRDISMLPPVTIICPDYSTCPFRKAVVKSFAESSEPCAASK